MKLRSAPTLRTLAVLAAAAAFVVVPRRPATAHAELVSSDPPAGARLTRLPSTLTLRFSENVDIARSAVVVVPPDGPATDLLDLAHTGDDDTSLIATIPASLKGSGDLGIRWRSVSTDDGHVASGAYDLRLAVAAVTAPVQTVAGLTRPTASPTTNPSGVAGAFTAVRMLNYLALAVLCGGLGFVALLWPAGADVARSRRLLYGACLVGLVTTGMGLGLQGAFAAQKPLLSALSPSVVDGVLATTFGRVWVCKGLLFLLAFPVLWMLSVQGSKAARGVAWKVGAAAVSVGLLRMPGLIGHASEARHAALGSVADFAHLAGISIWLGGLVFVSAVILPRRQPAELARLLPRFSVLALGAVVTISVAGLVMSWQLLGSMHALTSTRFGHVLLVKLGLFVVLIAAAQLSKRWVSNRLNLAVFLEGDAVTLRPFVASIAVEVALALAVLSVASILVNTHPAH